MSTPPLQVVTLCGGPCDGAQHRVVCALDTFDRKIDIFADKPRRRHEYKFNPCTGRFEYVRTEIIDVN